MEFLSKILEAGVVFGGVLIAGKFLLAAIARDAAQRISINLKALQIFSKILGLIPFMRHPLWSGRGTICWTVESHNFEPENCDIAQIFRVFGTVGLEAKVKRADGKKVPYRFIGKLSREKTILTGEWFDSRGKAGNYHGAYQIRVLNAKSMAVGKWIGFSDTKDEVKVGEMRWEKHNQN